MRYPDYSLQELEKKRRFFEDFCAGRADRPMLFRGAPAKPDGWQAPDVKLAGPSERIEEVDNELIGAIQEFSWRLESGVADDYAFAFHLDRRWFGGSQAFCEPFGGKIIPDETDPYHWWARPAVANVADALKIKEPKELGPHLSRVPELMAYVRESVEGAYPVASIVITGPFDTASYVLGFEPLMEAVYTEPRAVHHILDLITDFLIGFVHRCLEATGVEGRRTEAAMAGFQGGEGWFAFCSESRAVLSDAILAEFETPYLKRMRDEFGMQYIHSCGNWVHHMPRLVSEGYADCVDFCHPESDFGAVVRAVGGKTAVRPTTNATNATYLLSPEEWYWGVLSALTDETRLILDVPYADVKASVTGYDPHHGDPAMMASQGLANVHAYNAAYDRLEMEGRLPAPLRNLGRLE